MAVSSCHPSLSDMFVHFSFNVFQKEHLQCDQKLSFISILHQKNYLSKVVLVFYAVQMGLEAAMGEFTAVSQL